ncbi:MAG: hypothetical protein Q4P07_11830 [Ornithinimicrobium sp.]|uniref:hypothetical protein n=1 Tax=Ornithinimicrobium sp. TaxID=1977084 RepID=UPI0026DEA75E|nr:hypothetical protein [Ornithinimicrobium sp.]MDO5740822.1 hypothetical protein [Ornithinimicrobium sp.]
MRGDERSPALLAGVDFRGTTNATERVSEHIKPGKQRAPFARYIRINLPRTVRLTLLAVVAFIGVAAAVTALGDIEPFPFADPILWTIGGAALVFVVVGLATSARLWAWGTAIAGAAILTYLLGLAGTPPYVWNGASIPQAAMWNLVLLLSLAYLVLVAALRYGMIVAAPDNQNFMD